MVRHHLRLHRHVLARAPLLHELPPILHAVLRIGEERSVFLAIDQRDERAQHRAAIADQPHIDVVAQSDARRVDVDLNSLRLPGLRIEIQIGKAAARDEERIAVRERLLRRCGAEQPDAAGRVLAVVGDDGLAEERLDDRRAELLRELENLGARIEASAACEYRDLRAFVDQRRGALERRLRRERMRRREDVRAVLLDVSRGAMTIARRPLLDVLGNAEMRDGASREGGLDRLVHHVVHVRGAHDALVELGDIHEELVEIDVLLVMRADEIVESVPRDREYRLPIALGIVEPIEQMDASGSRRRETDSEPARVLRVAARCERGRFLVSHLHEGDLLLPRAQCFEDAVDPVTGKSEDRIDAPFDEPVDEQIGDGVCHGSSTAELGEHQHHCSFDSKALTRAARATRRARYHARELFLMCAARDHVFTK